MTDAAQPLLSEQEKSRAFGRRMFFNGMFVGAGLVILGFAIASEIFA